jgi:sugar phosphate isomerase/epimerase
MTVLLGTVALEPNRWGTVDPSRRATIDLAEWLPGAADAVEAGVELWEGHLSDAVLAGPLPVAIFNTYASLDDPDDTCRRRVAAAVDRAGSRGVKFNIGPDPASAAAYAERVAAWLDLLPAGAALLCECHEGTAAWDPTVAAAVLHAAGPPERVGAIVHTHEPPDQLRTRFDAYGERIAHVHVNFLDGATAPRLVEVRDRLAQQVALLRSLGFTGSWTVELVHGLLTDRDEPAALLAQAADDLAVLREVLAQ